MVKRSKGSRSQTRSKLRKNPRQRGLTAITRSLQEFEPGDVVAVDIEPSYHKGQPHPRFQGTTGKVVEERGRAYVIAVRDGNAHKELIARPEHLRPLQTGKGGRAEGTRGGAEGATETVGATETEAGTEATADAGGEQEG